MSDCKSMKCYVLFILGTAKSHLEITPASLFPFLDRGNYSRGSKNGVSASAQAKLRFAHLLLRLKQQLLRSKDGNGNCSCRDSDVDHAETYSPLSFCLQRSCCLSLTISSIYLGALTPCNGAHLCLFGRTALMHELPMLI
jgi:hypothetical protein